MRVLIDERVDPRVKLLFEDHCSRSSVGFNTSRPSDSAALSRSRSAQTNVAAFSPAFPFYGQARRKLNCIVGSQTTTIDEHLGVFENHVVDRLNDVACLKMLFEEDDRLHGECSVDFPKAFALPDRGTDLHLSQGRHRKESIYIAAEKATHPLSARLVNVELHDSARIQEIETQGLSPVTYDSR